MKAEVLKVDALSADYTYINPYNYAENNPIINIDLHGLQAFNAIQNGLIGNDAQGYIRAATDQTREYSPFKASVADATFFCIRFIGLNAVIMHFLVTQRHQLLRKYLRLHHYYSILRVEWMMGQEQQVRHCQQRVV
ncbi:MAG: hypothetical protein IPL08_13980 [Saprospiraceae bacterium]|nr:hypothetical protein [Saprospiraceae bacterium]